MTDEEREGLQHIQAAIDKLQQIATQLADVAAAFSSVMPTVAPAALAANDNAVISTLKETLQSVEEANDQVGAAFEWPEIGSRMLFIGGRVIDDFDNESLTDGKVHYRNWEWCEVEILDTMTCSGVHYCAVKLLPTDETGWIWLGELRPIQQSRAKAGQKLSLNDTPLYDSIHPAAMPVEQLSGVYYAYDGKQCEAVIRICKTLADVEATPIDEHCLGWVRYDQVRKIKEEK